MKLKLVTFIFFISVISLSAQNIYDYENSVLVLEADSAISNRAPAFILYIHSSMRCGYCHLLRRDIAKQKIPDKLRIVFLESDVTREEILQADSTYLGYEVRRVTVAPSEGRVKLFPTSQLVRTDKSRVVKKYRGYPYDFWKDLFRRINED